MSGRVFVVADLHLGHAKIAALRGFAYPELHDTAVVLAWNAVVDKRDVVYVLGDVFRLDRVPELHGIKKLTLGNHDTRPVAEYAALFSKVAACFDFDDCLLTHIPVHPSQQARWRLNIHGHTHTRHLDDPWYVPVSIEHCTRLEPLPLRELIQSRRDAWKGKPSPSRAPERLGGETAP